MIAAFLLLYVLLEVRQPYFFLWDDNAAYFLPVYVHNWRAVMHEHVVPLLNMHQYLGQTHLAQGQSAVLYPLGYVGVGLALLFNKPFAAIDIVTIMHLLIAAVGMYAVARANGSWCTTAALAGLAYGTLPFAVLMAQSWMTMTYVLAFLPWYWLVMQRFVSEPTVGRGVLVGATRVLFVMVGAVQYVVVLLVVEVVYLLLQPRPVQRVLLWPYAVSLVVTPLLGAPVLLPMLEAQRLSAYRHESLSYGEFISFALPLGAWLKAQFFLFAGRTIHGASSAIFYIGLPAIVLFGVILWHGRYTRRIVSLGTVTVVAFVFSTAAWSILYQLPYVQLFRWSFRFYGISMFFLLATLATWQHWRAVMNGVLVLTVISNFFVVLRTRDGMLSMLRLHPESVPAIPADGRVASYVSRHNDTTAIAPELLFHSATLFGAYHVGGYDPIVAKKNFDASGGLFNASQYHELTTSVRERWNAWGVRFVIVPRRDVSTVLAQSGFHVASTHGDYVVVENAQRRPLAFLASAPQQALSTHMNSVGVNIRYQTPTPDVLTVAVAALEYDVTINGQPTTWQEDAWGRMRIAVPSGEHEVHIRYRATAFRLGVALTVATVLVLARLGFGAQQLAYIPRNRAKEIQETNVRGHGNDNNERKW